MRNNKYSDLKILGFPDKIRSFERGEITAPLYVRVKPTNVCNEDCHFCCYASSNRKDPSVKTEVIPHIQSKMHEDITLSDSIPTPKLIEVLDDFKAMGVKAVTYSGGGEPLFYKDIVAVMDLTLRYGIDLSILTNGVLLKGDRAAALAYSKWVRVSIDYTNAEQRTASRRTPAQTYDMVMNNLQEFAKIKQPDCDLGVNYIVHKANYEGLVPFTKQLKDLGVENVRFSPIWIPNFEEYHAPITKEVDTQLREAAKLLNDDKFQVQSTYSLQSSAHYPHRAYKKCWVMQTVPVVAADQNVYACHNKAYDKKGLIGSIKDKRFKDLWFSSEAKAVFEGLNPECDCRHQCSSDSKNIFIHKLLDTSVDNFV